MEIFTFLLGLTFLALALTGAGLGVAAVQGLLGRRKHAAGEFDHQVRAGSCAALRRFSGWWLLCAAAWLAAGLVLRFASGS